MALEEGYGLIPGITQENAIKALAAADAAGEDQSVVRASGDEGGFIVPINVLEAYDADLLEAHEKAEAAAAEAAEKAEKAVADAKAKEEAEAEKAKAADERKSAAAAKKNAPLTKVEPAAEPAKPAAE